MNIKIIFLFVFAILLQITRAQIESPVKINWPQGCSQKGGCLNGYCWAGCAGAVPNLNGAEWCYTDDGNGNKKQCKQDSDCDKCAKCNSLCSV